MRGSATEVSDVLDEFLNFALAHEEAGLPGLTSLHRHAGDAIRPEIKREQDKGRDEVRIMTGACLKGGWRRRWSFLVDGGSETVRQDAAAEAAD